MQEGAREKMADFVVKLGSLVSEDDHTTTFMVISRIIRELQTPTRTHMTIGSGVSWKRFCGV